MDPVIAHDDAKGDEEGNGAKDEEDAQQPCQQATEGRQLKSEKSCYDMDLYPDFQDMTVMNNC